MKKNITTFMMMIMSLFLLPISVFASAADNPVDKMSEKLKFNWKIIENADFIFSPAGIVISALTIGALLFTIVRVFIRITKISSGKASIKDKWFWIEVGIVLFILFFFFSGGFFKLLSQVYEWTSNQDITGGTP
ncbi:hypothetical protein AAXB25_33460 [Paenibacillus lautus]|uniref:hypothetical protein n=1 Tax=Paenibacillus lautus TaxID=1401 RepID=UPI003D299E3E